MEFWQNCRERKEQGEEYEDDENCVNLCVETLIFKIMTKYSSVFRLFYTGDKGYWVSFNTFGVTFHKIP